MYILIYRCRQNNTVLQKTVCARILILSTACTCSRRCSVLSPGSCSHSRSSPAAWAARGCDTPSSPRSPRRGSCLAGPGPSQTSPHSHCGEATTTRPGWPHCDSPEQNFSKLNSFRLVTCQPGTPHRARTDHTPQYLSRPATLPSASN